MFTLLLFFISSNSNAQLSTWEWASESGGTGRESGQKIVQYAGNAYVVGNFNSDTLIIGDDTLLNHGIGTTDVFVASYNYLGAPVWAISFGGANAEEGLDIAFNLNDGSLYITGSYASDSLIFDSTTLINSGTATREMFLIKLNTLGGIIWAKDMGGPDVEEGRSLISDNSGNIYVTGGFRSSGVTFGSSILTPQGTGDVFILKYDDAGNEIWASSAGGNNFQEGNGICLDNWNNLYITGMFYSDSITFGSTTLLNFGSGDGFIAKYDSAGNNIWAKNFGGALFEESNAILVDDSYPGNLYITGAFRSDTAMFDSTGIYNFDTSNSRDVFVARYDTSGAAQWAQAAAGPGDETGYDIATASFYLSYGIYVIGNTESPVIQAGSFSANTNGSSDVFVLRYQYDYCYWGTTVGGINAEHGLGIVSDAPFYFYTTGSFESAIVNFDTCTVINTDSSDAFVARYRFPNSVRDLNTTPSGHLLVYPNPTLGSFTVALPEGAQSLQIVNLSGQVIVSENVNGKGTAEYQLPQSGLYFVIVNTTEGKIAGKVSVNN